MPLFVIWGERRPVRFGLVLLREQANSQVSTTEDIPGFLLGPKWAKEQDLVATSHEPRSR